MMQNVVGKLCRPRLQSLYSVRFSQSAGYHSRHDSKEVIRDDLHALYKKLRWYQGTLSLTDVEVGYVLTVF